MPIHPVVFGMMLQRFVSFKFHAQTLLIASVCLAEIMTHACLTIDNDLNNFLIVVTPIQTDDTMYRCRLRNFIEFSVNK